jgi:signal transduction histidine kinase
MKRRLWFKLTGSFAVLILICSIIIAVSINISTFNYYKNLINKNDLNLARELSFQIGMYYEVMGSWEGIRELIERFPFGPGFMPMHMGNMNPGDIIGDVFSRIVLTDNDNNIIADTVRGSYGKLTGNIKNGYPVYAFDRQVGILYVGSMISSGLKPLEEKFLNSVNISIIITTALIIILAIILGTILISQITKPLKQFSAAAQSISAGNYDIHVKIPNKDELGEMALSFNSMADSLKETENWKKQLISNSAHELRTPVSLIQGHLEMMLEGVYKINKENIRSIYTETERLARLISELESLSTAESGKLELKREKADIFRIAEHSIEVFQPLADEKEIKFTLFSESKRFKVFADIQKAGQVFSNIISNAIRYSLLKGRIEIEIKRSEDDSAFVKISIKDSGPGIPDKDLEKIFERFYRVESSRNRESGGSGLGLSICSSIIKLHGGRIWAEKNIKKGACFCFTLPLVKE